MKKIKDTIDSQGSGDNGEERMNNKKQRQTEKLVLGSTLTQKSHFIPGQESGCIKTRIRTRIGVFQSP